MLKYNPFFLFKKSKMSLRDLQAARVCVCVSLSLPPPYF
jgi:hypothetical protein